MAGIRRSVSRCQKRGLSQESFSEKEGAIRTSMHPLFSRVINIAYNEEGDLQWSKENQFDSKASAPLFIFSEEGAWNDK